MNTTSAYQEMFKTFGSYKAFLQNLPQQVESVIRDLKLSSIAEFNQYLEPALLNIMPTANNRLNTWRVELDRTRARHDGVILFINDLIMLSEQLTAATATMTRGQTKLPLYDLDLRLPSFTLATLHVINAGPIDAMVEQIKREINNLCNEFSNRTFYLSSVTVSIPLIMPRIIDFMEGAIRLYTEHKNIDLSAPHNDTALASTIEAATKIEISYKATHSTAADVRSYCALIDELLYRTQKIVVRIFANRIRIDEFETMLTQIVLILKEVKCELQQV
ncbi:hypothetical protein [Pseudomonas sp.]|uniref:hypothetical protein n=1 Tax=Pseudomonas sp. TaxID=306 RepID=UPI0026314A07|nr:hypothetical protein [Pseudomonas sp.]